MAVIEQTKWQTLPMGEYNAVITDVQIADGLYGEQCEFLFTIQGGEHDGINLKGWTSTAFSPKSKLYAWAKAAFGGKPIPEDYALDTDHLIRRKVNLLVIIRVKPEDGSEFNKIDGLRPYRPLPGGAGAIQNAEQAPLPQGSGQQAPLPQGGGQQAPQAQAKRPQGGGLPFPAVEEDEIPF